MDINTTALFIAIVTATVSPLIAAFVTLSVERNKAKKEDKEREIEKDKQAVELQKTILEDINNQNDKLQLRLTDCNKREELAMKQSRQMRILFAQLILDIMKLSERIRNVYREHEEIATENCRRDCPGYPIIQQTLDKITVEIEEFGIKAQTQLDAINYEAPTQPLK